MWVRSGRGRRYTWNERTALIKLRGADEPHDQIVQVNVDHLALTFTSRRAALTDAHFQLCLMIRRQHSALTRGCAPLARGGAHVARQLCRGAMLLPRCTARHAAETRSKAPEGQSFEQDEADPFLGPRTLICHE
jgi:hypothetical protein